MTRLKTVAITALLFVVGWIGYYWMTKVDHPDVLAFHDYSLPFDPPRSPLRPGDVVAVTPDNSIYRLCSLKPAQDQAMPSMVTAAYYNDLRERFPEFIDSIDAVKGLFGESAAAEEQEELRAERREVVLRGVNLVMEEEWDVFVESDCEVRTARALSKGRLPCTVEKSLISEVMLDDGVREMRTLAVRLKTHPNWVGPKVFDDNGIAVPDNLDGVFSEKCTAMRLPIDAMVRRWIGAIAREAPVIRDAI
ncbi:hypothetical protein OCH239_02465 [Roseivivax halodurans JCM 10272]|uniref:Uncharacterized protein n=1 Tax=Roseivivax halodurans JCM 10272 TaxID=1449350 RepID=X7EHG9_9RHOB|nr:hypothetical protein [Roseivivax halodurans]ETX14573.1 hypothetical protein OCH239_02465 [Roseivivax halodurans JCM 10272]